MAGWNHQLNGHEFEQTLGDSEDRGDWCAKSMGSQRVRHNLAIEQQQQRKWVLNQIQERDVLKKDW